MQSAEKKKDLVALEPRDVEVRKYDMPWLRAKFEMFHSFKRSIEFFVMECLRNNPTLQVFSCIFAFPNFYFWICTSIPHYQHILRFPAAMSSTSLWCCCIHSEDMLFYSVSLLTPCASTDGTWPHWQQPHKSMKTLNDRWNAALLVRRFCRITTTTLCTCRCECVC